MRVVLYARVSTSKCDVCGRKKSSHTADVGHAFKGQNPEVQFAELRAWCVSRKYLVVGEYVDRISGGKFKRPALDGLIADCLKGRRDIEAVVVQRLDRFGRSVLELHSLVNELRQGKVDFVSISEGFDLTTAGGEALFGMLCVFAQFERRMISDRTRSGMALARAEGRLPGPKIDPKRGPSRTTRWRREQQRKSA